MKFWWRARGALRDVLTLLAMLASLFLAGQDTIPIPTLSGVATPTPVAVFAPLMLVISVGFGLSRRIDAEFVAARPIHLLDGAWIAALVVIAVAASTVLDTSGPQQLGLIAARDTVGYIGLTLIGWRILGNHASAIVSVGYAIAAALLGYGAAGKTAPWAWPVAGPRDSLAMVVAIAIGCAGIATLANSSFLRAFRA